MTDTPARLLRLLSLLQSGREWPGRELAGRLGVSRRTVRRDVDRLRELGYPVAASMGVAGGYRLVAGAALPPLLLDDEEAVAITVGLRMTAGQAVAGIEEASVRALAKVQQVLPTRLRHRVSSLGSAMLTAGPQPAGVEMEHLTVLSGAVANRERLRFDYTGADGTSSRRTVEPHRLVAHGRRWYLVAYDGERLDWRTFRLDRIGAPESTRTRFAARPLPAADAAAYLTETLYGLAPTYRAVVTLHAPAGQVAPALGGGRGALTPIAPGTCRWDSHADTLDWLAFRLTTLGCDFTVHQPSELINHVRELAGRLARAVS